MLMLASPKTRLTSSEAIESVLIDAPFRTSMVTWTAGICGIELDLAHVADGNAGQGHGRLDLEADHGALKIDVVVGARVGKRMQVEEQDRSAGGGRQDDDHEAHDHEIVGPCLHRLPAPSNPRARSAGALNPWS